MYLPYSSSNEVLPFYLFLMGNLLLFKAFWVRSSIDSTEPLLIRSITWVRILPTSSVSSWHSFCCVSLERDNGRSCSAITGRVPLSSLSICLNSILPKLPLSRWCCQGLQEMYICFEEYIVRCIHCQKEYLDAKGSTSTAGLPFFSLWVFAIYNVLSWIYQSRDVPECHTP